MVLQAGTFTACGKRRKRRSRIFRGLLSFDGHDGGFRRLGHLVGVPKRPRVRSLRPSTPHCSFRSRILYPVLRDMPNSRHRPAQRSHALPVLVPDHEPHSFVHNRAFLPWHPHFLPLKRLKVLPMSLEGSVIYVSDRPYPDYDHLAAISVLYAKNGGQPRLLLRSWQRR